ncbi:MULTISPECIES: uroporphyrinogen-III synthase [Aliiglaciecola]|uniref:uroporphyrinogen-III synthase n=1 Tax=Aliiglaciecola TaxID=1406885 RepID=UPI001C087249|nr:MULTISPECIES: uroporphyrinogen-III synthase [Aliiglaciecola]MBU2878939.1 uroporphyrinogen-III synthase [Aliiglaciecola lipolytica]MDO6710623.1 uroporphyrinogen-III synthase [Aliiglaciecola sp. 2_MG-2023]MDO6754290.1 uroporphyrinogen-III synthase [Aliiglaciecola sp. 1_MG-2023]
MSILLLRPKEKFEKSTRYLQQQGIRTVGVGLIEIDINQDNLQQFAQTILAMDAQQISRSKCIFVSTHAAEIVIEGVKGWPSELAVFAVGPSTGERLTQLTEQVIVPDMACSEGLLSLPQLQNLSSHKVFLLKGVGGRKMLPSELQQRGAEVEHINLYNRLPCVNYSQTEAWQQQDIQCIVATSGEIIQAAWDKFDQNWLKSTPWIMVSQRLADYATKLGIQQVYLSAGASDEQLKDAINQFLER